VVKNSTSARSPLSPTRWPRSAFVWWGSLLLAAAVVVAAFFASSLIAEVLVTQYGLNVLRQPPAWSAILLQTFGVYVPVLLVFGWGLPWLAQRSWRELGLRRPTLGDVAWGATGAVLMFVAIEAVGALEEHLVHTKISETAVELLKSTRGPMVYLFAAFACIAAPFVEELVFRGFLFNAFLRYTPPVVAVVLSGALFGAAHGDPHSWPAMLPLAAGGLVLGTFYYRTGSLAVSMIAHATFNLISVIGLLVFHAA
jgi:membrane protease YdiL (CAAX protease family)